MKRRIKFVGFAVLVIIVLMAIGGLYCPEHHRFKWVCAKYAKTEGEFSHFVLVLDLYEADNGKYPDQLQDLIRNRTSISTWRGPYLTNGIPSDAWGNEIFYQHQLDNAQQPYTLSSAGPDGKCNTEDDIRK